MQVNSTSWKRYKRNIYAFIYDLLCIIYFNVKVLGYMLVANN